MTWSKIQNFNTNQQEIARLAKAVAHPARVAILQYLASRNSCISGDISDEIPLSRTTVSQHLQALKAAGFIKGELSGVKICYCLNESVMIRFKCMFESFLHEINTNQIIDCNQNQ